MTESEQEAAVPPREPIFKLDLGANGGVFAPHSAQEIIDWVQREIGFWEWVQGVNVGNHRGALDHALKPLRQTAGVAQECIALEAQHDNPTSAPALLERAEQVQKLLQEALINRRLPHSSSVLGKRIEAHRQQDSATAVAFAFVVLQPRPGNWTFEAQDISSWRGFIEGLPFSPPAVSN